jgi:hypothetical protein
MGLPAVQLDARLALAELGKLSNRDGALADIAAVQKDASVMGFGLIARKAAGAMR